MQLVRLVGIMLVVFIKDTLAPKIGNVATQIVATGIMGVMVSFCVLSNGSIARVS